MKNIVYSTDPNFVYEEDVIEQTTLPNNWQTLYISLDKKQRGGKKVTLIENFKGTNEDLQTLGKMLKTKCGVGGTIKDGIILIQGDFRDKVKDILLQNNYKIKLKG